MVSNTIYNVFVERFANKEIDYFGTTDTFNVVIHTDAPTFTTDDDLADLTQISSANGYPGSNDLQNDSTRTTNVVTMTTVDVTWTASGGNLGNSTTGRYFTSYDDTHANDALYLGADYGSTFTVASGETMTYDTGASYATLTG